MEDGDKREVTCLEDIYRELGKDAADRLVADAVGFRATTSPEQTLAAVAAGGCVELDEHMSPGEWDAMRGLVAGILEARESDPESPSTGIRSWLKREEGRLGKCLDDWMLSEKDVTAEDIACLCNLIWGEDGLWDGGFIERGEIASDLIGALEVFDLKSDGLDEYALAEDLVEMLGLEGVWVEGPDVAGMKFPQTALIGDKAVATGEFVPPESQTSCSRHAFDAALEHLLRLDGLAAGEAAPAFGEGAREGFWDYVAGSNLQWLCEAQGTTLADALTPGSESWGTPFAESLREEIVESAPCEYGYPTIAVFRETTVADQLALSRAAHDPGAPRAGFLIGDAAVGIFDPCNGCGGALDVNDRGVLATVAVAAPMVALPMLDCRATGARGRDRFCWSYNAADVHGLGEDFWWAESPALLAGDARLEDAYRASAPPETALSADEPAQAPLEGSIVEETR